MNADNSGERMILRIDTVTGVPVSDVAAMLSALDAAFRQFSKHRIQRGQIAKLRVHDVRHGSLEFILEVIDAAGKVLEAGKLLSLFATHLMDIATLLCGVEPTKITRADRKVVETISNPVANGHAVQINLVINGHAHFTFDAASASALQVSQASTAEAPANLVAAEVSPRYVTPQQIRSLSSDGVHGTALDVDSQWYARLEGGQGVLVPITAATHVTDTLQHKAAYLFRGSVQRGILGEQIGIYVAEVTRIGS